MATNPYFTQLHTQRFSFVGNPQQRDATYLKDQRFVNVYPELIKSPITDGKKYYLKKRPGLFPVFTNPSGGAGEGRGLFFWNGFTYQVIGNRVYKGGNLMVVVLNTTTGPVGFTVFQNDVGTRVLCLADGHDLWIFDALDNITNAPGVPVPHVPMPVFMDGYLFLAQANTNVIWNSNLNDPHTWPTDGFLNAEMYPYSIQALIKSMNYVIAVTEGSIEFFYDNANATGSPLQRNAPAVSQLGTPAPWTVNQTEKEMILVGTTEAGGRTVWFIDGFQPKEIGIEPIREALDLEADAIVQARAFTIQSAGHKWYVLNLYHNQRTFVFDFDEQMWHEWTSGVGLQGVFLGTFAFDGGDGYPFVQFQSNGFIYELTPDVFTDAGNDIVCWITTIKIDFDSIKRKRWFRLSIIGDSPNGDNNTMLGVQFSDDDYNTWSGERALQMNGDYSTITNLGISRRRAFRFIYDEPFALRLEAFEVDITQEVRR